MNTTLYQISTRRNVKLDKFAFGTPRLPDLLCKHWFTSSVCNFCRWIADVPPRETSPAARSGEKRLFSQANSIPFNSSNVALNSKGLHQSSGKVNESCCLLFPSSTKREIRQFHVVLVQRWQRNVQKSVLHVQRCCFAWLNLLLFCRSRCCRRRRCVNYL